jgi:hypothetical protein
MMEIMDNSYWKPRFLKTMLALLLIVCFSPWHPAWGRTITLVYDDSTSMTGNGKWGYANYAAQSLVALLNDNDTLSVVKTSKPGFQQIETFTLKSPKSRQETVKNIQKAWRVEGGTPYQAVSNAVEYSISKAREKKQLSTEETQENDWLVIMTDGAFTQNEVDSSGKKDIERLLKDTDGKVRVIVFLIGSDPDRYRLPKLWSTTMPIDLIEAEEKPKQIISSMEQIAALVTGRDVDPIPFERNTLDPKEINFESPFPLRRLIVFEQKPEGKRISLQRFLIDNMMGETVFPEVDVETPNDQQLEKVVGRVTQGKGGEILSPGKYNLSFDHEVKKAEVQVLAESAVDFSVSLYSDTNTKVQSATGNNYEVCIGDPLKIIITFFTKGNTSPIMLDGLSSKLSVTAVVADKNISLNPALTKNAMEGVITAVAGQQILSAEAKYPGYFLLKSNILTISGKACAEKVNAGIQSSEGEPISLSYIWADSMNQGAKSSLVVTNDGSTPEGHYTITASGLPKGVELSILGKTVSQQQPSMEIDIPHGTPVEVAFLRNRDFREDKKFTVKLTASTDRKVKWLQQEVAYMIQPVPRSISGQLSGPAWSVPVDELESLQPVTVDCIADKKPVAADELMHWKVTGEADGIDLSILKDEKTQTVDITPKAKWGFICFTKVGVMPVQLKLHGPFPGEETEITTSVTIQDIPWWKKWSGVISLVLTVLFLAWYLIGLLRKERFSRMAQIHYAEKIATRKQLTGQFTDLLAGNWVSRYMIPYVPEKKLVRDIVFQAGSSEGQIVIIKKQQRQGMIINNNEIVKPERDISLLANQNLIERQGNREKIYTYING